MVTRARLSALVTDSSVTPEDLGRLTGGEPEYVAQDQYGALARRQQLHRGDEGQ